MLHSKQNKMERKLGDPKIRYQILESTNEFVLGSLKERKFNEGTIVIAGFQTHGEGMGENRWESEKDKNLLLSLVLKPVFLEPAHQFYLNKFASLAVYDFVKHVLPDKNVTVKWPNDVYIDDKKVAGILINNTIIGKHFEYVVLGIGLNINQKTFKSDAPNPVSLIHHTNKELNLEECLQSLLHYLNSRYEQLKVEKSQSLDGDYLNVLYRYQNWSEFKTENRTFKGRITGITEYGQLQIEEESGKIQEYDFKTVEFSG